MISLPSWAAEKMRLRVDDYQIDAELNPHSHKIKAHAKVKFTALEDLNAAVFELHNGLRVTKVTDDGRQAADGGARRLRIRPCAFQLTSDVPKTASTTLTFEYEGELNSADDSPVQGLKLASIGDDTTYLLYAGRWFPVNAYGINRFTATINITVPAHMIVIGSGKETVGRYARAKKAAAGASAHQDLHLRLGQAQLSRHHRGREFSRNSRATKPGLDLHVFFKPIHQNLGSDSTPRPRSKNSPIS